MKRTIISITILLISFLIIFLFLNNKEKKKNIENKNISIILETEEGNIKSNTFPDKDFYEYSNIVCENTNDEIDVVFNEEAWKLNLSVEKEKVDGNFNCIIYFKYTPRIASDYIISKYKENNDERLIKIDQPATGQTPAQTEYRYSGSNDVVKNYVTFNNETWRIIGVFPTDDGTGNVENRIKIIREESIGDYSWDTSVSTINTGYGINQWGSSGSYEGADLMRLLNPGYESESVNNSLYWNRGNGTCYSGYQNATTTCDFSSTGLTENAKEMIDNTKWYTSASNRDITASESYAEERASTTTDFSSKDGVTRTTNWTGKVGLMYPSDYGYASSGCRNGEQVLADYSNETCTSTNWLYNSDYQWLLSPDAEHRDCVRRVLSYGYVHISNADSAIGVRLVTYLSSSVKITGGSGTSSDPYTLSL